MEASEVSIRLFKSSSTFLQSLQMHLKWEPFSFNLEWEKTSLIARIRTNNHIFEMILDFGRSQDGFKCSLIILSLVTAKEFHLSSHRHLYSVIARTKISILCISSLSFSDRLILDPTHVTINVSLKSQIFLVGIRMNGFSATPPLPGSNPRQRDGFVTWTHKKIFTLTPQKTRVRQGMLLWLSDRPWISTLSLLVR